jgi:hypothetical protein
MISAETESDKAAEKSGVTVMILQVNTMGSGTRWRSWLRHCATSRMAAGSISDGAIRVFH